MANFQPLSIEYELHRKLLSKVKLAGVADAMTGLRSVLGVVGPDDAHADSLDYLRKHILKGDESAKVMELAGLDPEAKGAAAAAGVKTAASLKFLRHLYMVGGRGNQKIWVLATPKSYQTWPMDELLAARAQNAQIKTKLADVAEVLNEGSRTKLGEAMMLGLAWAQAATMTLANAAGDANAMAKVKRWFAEGSTSKKDLDKSISKAQAGFKKIVNSLNQHLVLVTEMPSLRVDPDRELTEAFVLNLAKGSERPRTIYVEKALQQNYDVSVLHDMKKNWARVLVHECTHSDCGTEDNRYAYRGIQPGANLTAGEAANNADLWAFFSADAAGALTAGEITRALGGTAGNLTKLATNWN